MIYPVYAGNRQEKRILTKELVTAMVELERVEQAFCYYVLESEHDYKLVYDRFLCMWQDVIKYLKRKLKYCKINENYFSEVYSPKSI